MISKVLLYLIRPAMRFKTSLQLVLKPLSMSLIYWENILLFVGKTYIFNSIFLISLLVYL